MWLALSGFMGMGLASRLSLASHLSQPVLGLVQGPSWWCLHLSAKMASSAKDSGRLVVSSLLLAPPKSSWLVFKAAPCPISGLPVVRPLMQVAIIVLGQGGQFQSLVPSPNKHIYLSPFDPNKLNPLSVEMVYVILCTMKMTFKKLSGAV